MPTEHFLTIVAIFLGVVSTILLPVTIYLVQDRMKMAKEMTQVQEEIKFLKQQSDRFWRKMEKHDESSDEFKKEVRARLETLSINVGIIMAKLGAG